MTEFIIPIVFASILIIYFIVKFKHFFQYKKLTDLQKLNKLLAKHNNDVIELYNKNRKKTICFDNFERSVCMTIESDLLEKLNLSELKKQLRFLGFKEEFIEEIESLSGDDYDEFFDNANMIYYIDDDGSLEIYYDNISYNEKIIEKINHYLPLINYLKYYKIIT